MSDTTPTTPPAGDTPAPDQHVPTRRERVRPWLTRALLALLPVASALAAQQGCPRVVQVLNTVEVLVPAEDADSGPPPEDARYAQGWVPDPDEVAAVAAALPQPVFALTPAGVAADPLPDRVYLWQLARDELGRHLPTRDQGRVGSCVAFGVACAVEYQQLAQVADARKAGRTPPEFRAVSTEVIYGGSRVQIGGGRIRGDGSTGAWGAKWSNQYGAVDRAVHGRYDLTRYSEATCRAFGAQGCPKELEPVAKRAPTNSVTRVLTVDEAKRALANKYPVTVASSIGFGERGPYVRNAKGQLRPSGTWNHQMCLIGYDRDSGFYCMNSWGERWVGGPTGPGDPPPGGFWIDETTVARMLGQGDSWAFGDQTGFPAKRLDWFVRRAQDPRRADPITLFALTP